MDLDRLQALAKDATPGPWEPLSEGDLRDADDWCQAQGIRKADAAYVGAADPQTVLQLIAIAKAAKEYQRGMFRPGSTDLTQAWTGLCAALAGVQDDK